MPTNGPEAPAHAVRTLSSTGVVAATPGPRAVVALGLWLLGLSYLTATTRPLPIVELIGAIVLGLLAALLSVQESAGASRAAKSMVWVNAIGGLVWAMAFAPDMFAGAWLAGVCAFGFVVSLARLLRRPVTPWRSRGRQTPGLSGGSAPRSSSALRR